MLERKKNGQIKGLIRICGWFFVTQYNLSLPSFVPNFKILGQVVPEKSLTENFVREKEKWTNKGTDKNMWLVLCYTVQFVITKLCTKFQDPRSSSS